MVIDPAPVTLANAPRGGGCCSTHSPAMFVPALDMLLAVIRRTRAGVHFTTPDKMHLHHRLLQIGHSHRRVVLLIYLWVGIVALGAASTIFFDPRYTGAVMLAAIVVAIVVTLIPLLRGREDVYDEE